MNNRFAFNPCLAEQNTECLSGAGSFPCTEETLRKYKPDLDESPPNAHGNSCYCYALINKKKQWLGVREATIKKNNEKLAE